MVCVSVLSGVIRALAERRLGASLFHLVKVHDGEGEMKGM
jgi:hypothetical protein